MTDHHHAHLVARVFQSVAWEPVPEAGSYLTGAGTFNRELEHAARFDIAHTASAFILKHSPKLGLNYRILDIRTLGKWRVGTKLGRTLYLNDQLVGLMDTPELAAAVVDAMVFQK